jgi:hypothetical protein
MLITAPKPRNKFPLKRILDILFRSKLHNLMPTIIAPERTDQMRGDGFVWQQIGETWYPVCDTCGGNCGQCGTSLGMGIPASLGTIVKSTDMDSGNHAGLPTG